jgi:cell division protein ZapA
MTEQSAIDTAVKRLALALDALDAAVERRKQADRNEEGLAAQVQALGVDRTRLAAALDGETARSRQSSRCWTCTSNAMAQISSTIAGRQFRLACEDGQEEHLQELAKDIDQRIISLRRKFGEIGDTRLTVMAALMVADELAETIQKMHRLEEDIASLQDARLVASDRARAASDAVIGAFNSAAERIEGITRKLNQTVGNGGSVPIG